MNSDDAGRIVEMVHDAGLHVAAAFYEGDTQLVVDYTDPNDYQQNTHIKHLNALMLERGIRFGLGTAQSTEGFQRIVFTKARERLAK